jgi:2-hydroxychromene-2-carboxylate isomerase
MRKQTLEFLFGAPTLFVNSQMYFGQDRFEFVREALSDHG